MKLVEPAVARAINPEWTFVNSVKTRSPQTIAQQPAGQPIQLNKEQAKETTATTAVLAGLFVKGCYRDARLQASNI
jgi:hypothetical protein